MTRQEELALVKKIGQGDSEATVLFLRAYGPGINSLAYRYFPNNPADREDAVSSATIHAIARLNQFEGRSRLFTWIYRLATNRFREIRRAERALSRPPLEFVGGHDELRKLSRHDYCHNNALARLEVADVLALLQPHDAQLLVEHFIEDKTLQEMADARNIPIGTLKARVCWAARRARKLAA
jgi:RNA polymerase sigma-70 factor (ECF subfamily)